MVVLQRVTRFAPSLSRPDSSGVATRIGHTLADHLKGFADHLKDRGRAGRREWGRLWSRRPRVSIKDEKPRSMAISVLLGAILVGVSFYMYFAIVSPPQPPVVNGAGELYLLDPQVTTRMAVTYKPSPSGKNTSHIEIVITFFGAAGKPVDWALVLYGDARFADPGNPTATIIPPGARIGPATAGSPPLSGNPRGPVDVIRGRAYPKDLNAQSATQLITGDIPAVVAKQDGATFSLAMPRYGRVHLPPLFQFPHEPGALVIGIPGDWKQPERFEVDVDAGRNDVNQRIDLSSPDLADPTALYWESDESVHAVLRRTDLHRDAVQQTEVFVLGAVVGAGASVAIEVVEAAATGLRIRRREGGRA